MLIGVLLAMIATVGLFPDTEVGKFLRRLLIEEPARRLNSFSPRRAFFSVACFIVLLALAPMLIEAAIPMEFALLMAGDMVIYLEAATLIGVLAAQGRLRTLGRTIVSAAAWVSGRLRAPRRRRSTPSRLGRKNADDEGGALAFA